MGDVSPSLSEYREKSVEDPNYFWRLESGDHLNLLEEAVTRLNILERNIEKAMDLPEATCNADPNRGLPCASTEGQTCDCGANAYNRGRRNVQIALGKPVIVRG